MADSARFQELLKSLWECYAEDVGRLCGEAPELGAARSDFCSALANTSSLTTSVFEKIGDDSKGNHGAHIAAHKKQGFSQPRGDEVGAEHEQAEQQQKEDDDEEADGRSGVESQSKEESGMDLGLKHLWEEMANRTDIMLRESLKMKGTRTDARISVMSADHQAVIEQAMEDIDGNDEEPRASSGFCERRLISPPGSRRRLVWDLFGGLLVLYDMVKIPMLVFEPPDTPFTNGMSWLTLIFWTLDVPLAFMAGYLKDGFPVTDPKLIAKNYISGWLVIDLAVVLPDWFFTLILTAVKGDSVKLLRSLRMARIFRLVRLMKLKWILDAMIDYIDSEAVSMWVNIIRMLLVLLAINHFLGCTWYAIGSVNFGLPQWINDFEGQSWSYLYLTSLHWAVTQFTPASMNVQPANIYERAFAICVVFFALVVFSYIVGSITGSLTSLRELSSASSRQFWLLRRYLKRNNVPTLLSKRVIQFIQHADGLEKQKMNMAQVTIMRHLSPQLMAELKSSMNLPHLRVHPLFAHFHETATITMNKVAKDAVTRSSLAAKDVLFLPSQRGSAVYFVTLGKVFYSRTFVTGEVKSELVDANKAWLAEPALWCASWLHVGAASAQCNADLLSVDAKEFENILQSVTSTARLCSLYAQNFLHWLKKSELTDVIQGGRYGDTVRKCIPDE